MEVTALPLQINLWVSEPNDFMKLTIKDSQFKLIVLASLIAVLVLLASYGAWKGRDALILEKKDIRNCLNNFCISRGYDSMYSAQWIVSEYIKLTCKGISDFKFKMEDFDFYDYDLKGICIQYEN